MSASGHRGGIYSGREFGDAEKSLRKQREEDVIRLVQEHGVIQKTVFRDKDGRVTDKTADELEQARRKEEKDRAIKEAQYEWGKGLAQKKQKEERDREFEELKNEPFARTIDDPKLEKSRKETVRDGDPMAAYFEKRREKRKHPNEDEQEEVFHGNKRSSKPLYKGPNPTPNRFGIRPGYRWDAIDRGNGFEKKVLLKINENSSFNEEDYKWRVSDL